MQPPSTAKRKSEPSEDLSSKKQAKIDFKRKGRAIPQHMLEQDPITVSDTESVQIISRTMVGNPGKEPVVVINSPVNSPPRKTTQRPGTKPQNIVPRCLPCRGTHKPCEPDANDLDGPCKRCAKLGCPCKLYVFIPLRVTAYSDAIQDRWYHQNPQNHHFKCRRSIF